jgi:hypothetical protein
MQYLLGGGGGREGQRVEEGGREGMIKVRTMGKSFKVWGKRGIGDSI